MEHRPLPPPPPPSRRSDVSLPALTPSAPLELLLARAEEMQKAATPLVPPMSPQRAAELMGRAYQLEQQGDLSAAAAVFRRAAKAPSHTGAALSEMGRIQRLRGRPQDALSLYKQALHDLTDGRQIAWVYAEIGQLYFAMREDEEAEYYFRRAAKLDPRHVGLLERTRSDRLHPDLHEIETADIDLVTLQ
ncbi:MAG: tetratricopeptide repeat protein [Sandaracinaceae bacterium]|nr:tetratricopeptide repeat protein [Sandaracinaceae bacterium]